MVLARINVSSTLFGYWVWGERVSPKGPVHNLLVQIFTLGSSKIKVSKTYVLNIVTMHNDHPSYVKHVLGISYPIWVLDVGEADVSQGIGTKPAHAVFHPGQLKNQSF